MTTKTTTKTQISNLRSGTKNQILNPKIDYSTLSSATSHVGHVGSNGIEVNRVWEQVKSENPETMKILIKGIETELIAHWSLSGKSVSYSGVLPKDNFESNFLMKLPQIGNPSVVIQNANTITVFNGKNSYTNICPSLIEIL